MVFSVKVRLTFLAELKYKVLSESMFKSPVILYLYVYFICKGASILLNTGNNLASM